jgi:hypothetical protein
MGAASLLRFLPAHSPRVAAWITLAALFVAVCLLAYAVLLGVTSPGHSPANEPVLMGPFRWTPESAAA